jgi:urease accessory protein
MANRVPDTLISGLLSGFAHPVIGLDHLFFVIAVGLAAVKCKRPLSLPLVFVGGTLVGCAALIIGWELSVIEWAISVSLLILGLILLSRKKWHSAVYWILFAVAGWFHGAAYSEGILGAEATPLVAYLTGFFVIQYVVAVAVGAMVHQLWQAPKQLVANIRLVGAVVLGAGTVYFFEQLENVLWL